MSLLKTLNKAILQRTSTFVLAGMAGCFFFERTFDLVAVSIFETVNKGKLYKDIEASFPPPEE